MLVLGIVTALAAVAWLVLLTGHGGFWHTDQRLPARHSAAPELAPESPTREPATAEPAAWPEVVALVPARDEAAILPVTLPALLAQNYPGLFSVTLVDDASTDGTGEVAAAIGVAAPRPLRIVHGIAPPAGWAGKPWAMAQGLEATRTDGAPYVLFTDADIAWAPGALRALVTAAEGDDRDMVSQMALLRTETGWEKTIIPAFVYFFAQLYPFRWVNRPGGRTAAAAGGCMLIRRRALDAAGGLAPIRGALIDDVALGRLLETPSGPGPLLAWAQYRGPERPAVRGPRRPVEHGRSVGLHPASLLAVAAGRDAGRAGLALCAAPGQRDHRPDRSRGGRGPHGGERGYRAAAMRGGRCGWMGGDGDQLPADAPAVPAVAPAGSSSACCRGHLRGHDGRFGPPVLRRPRRSVEGPCGASG